MGKVAPGPHSGNSASVARSAVTAAESATINDSTFAPGNAVAGQAWRQILVFPRFVAGTAPTVTIEPLYRAGSGWVKLAKTSPLAEGQGVLMDVFGRDVFLRVDTITGTPTSVSVYVAGWEPFIFGGSTAR